MLIRTSLGHPMTTPCDPWGGSQPLGRYRAAEPAIHSHSHDYAEIDDSLAHQLKDVQVTTVRSVCV